MKLAWTALNLPFRYPFTISKGTKTHQPSLVVRLEHRGVVGYGEAPAITYYQVTVEQMIEELRRKQPMIERFAFTDPERYWHYLHHLLPAHPFLVCALDMAGWDLFGKLIGKPLWKYWDLDLSKAPLTDYTIGIDTIDRMVEKMQELPWPIYKIKVGTRQDLEVLQALRSQTEAVFRVDANAGWTVTQALEILPNLKALGVELVEQPLAKEDREAMKTLLGTADLPLIADESCVGEEDVAHCSGLFHGINIKLTKCSGITPALRMIREARSRGLSVMMGSMNESSIGSAAIAQLSPLLDFMDNDGPILLSEDIASGLSYERGKVLVSDQPGLGIEINTPF